MQCTLLGTSKPSTKTLLFIFKPLKILLDDCDWILLRAQQVDPPAFACDVLFEFCLFHHFSLMEYWISSIAPLSLVFYEKITQFGYL